MPRSEEQNERMRAESRARIIEHALRLFGQHGYEQTSIKMIAQAAGVAQGLLYNYFSGKEGLLRAIFEQSIQDVRESFAAAEADGDPRASIERLIRASFDILRRNLSFWRLSYGVRMQPGVVASLGPELHDWTDEIRRRVEGYLRRVGVAKPDVEAAILFAVIDGVSQHYVLDPERYPLDEVTETLVRRYREIETHMSHGRQMPDTDA